jgi:DNA-binding LacI/PurR family transcriptional regulator
MKHPAAYVSQGDVAKRAGVHQTTVSLVFRNHPSVPAETRERVMRVAREMGYKKHPLLAALMSTRLRVSPGPGNPVLAFLTDFERRDRWQESPTAVAMLAGARQRAQQLGYRVEIFWAGDPEVRPARLAEILKARNIHGLLLAPTHAPRALLQFDFGPFAVVGLGVSDETSSILSVAHDHFNGMTLAIRQAAMSGRQRLGVCLTIPANERVRERWLAAHALATKPNGTLARLPAWEGPIAEAAFAKWLKTHKPDALIGTFDRKVLPHLRSLGYDMPDDLAMVALSVLEDERFYAGIDQRSTDIGGRAVDLLVGALNHNEAGLLPMHQVLHIEGAWQPGKSLPT